MPVINWLEVIGGVLFALFVAYGTHRYDHAIYTEEKAVALAAQLKADTDKCNAEKLITKEAQDALQKIFDTISVKLAAAKLRHPATCIAVASGKTDVAGLRGEHAGQNGISSDWLRDYAAQCEQIRQTLFICENFIDKTWIKNGQ